MTILYNSNEERQVNRVVALLTQGKPVALPTETVYGLAGLALRESALAGIFKLKNRPTFDPLIVHVLGIDDIGKLVKEITPLHRQLVNAFWPGPLTLLFEKTDLISNLCTASLPFVAIRSPSHPVFREVLRRVRQPLAAPSANRFGQISPTVAEDVIKELGPYGLEAVLDGGACVLGIESTVVKIHKKDTGFAVEIVRLGSLSLEAIAKAIPENVPIEVRESGTGVSVESVDYEAPGQLQSHYAPRTPLLLFAKLSPKDQAFVVKNSNIFRYLEVFPDPQLRAEVLRGLPSQLRQVLSETSNDVEAAAQLFRALRLLDEQNPRAIILGALPESKRGLCPAIFDRLRRALSINELPS